MAIPMCFKVTLKKGLLFCCCCSSIIKKKTNWSKQSLSHPQGILMFPHFFIHTKQIK